MTARRLMPKVYYDWMTIVYRWMGFLERVAQVKEQLKCQWKTRVE